MRVLTDVVQNHCNHNLANHASTAYTLARVPCKDLCFCERYHAMLRYASANQPRAVYGWVQLRYDVTELDDNAVCRYRLRKAIRNNYSKAKYIPVHSLCSD